MLNIDGKLCNPTNTPRGFHVEMMWKQSFPRRFNAESTGCVCRELTFFCLQYKGLLRNAKVCRKNIR